jgi:hypothetical protein
MPVDINKQALLLIREALNEIESSKGSLNTAIQKMLRVALMIEDESLAIWCKIQLGDSKYAIPLLNYVEAFHNTFKERTKASEAAFRNAQEAVEKVGLVFEEHYSLDDLRHRSRPSGGFENVGFIEEKYADFVRTKSGNDGIYYKTNLASNLSAIRREAHERAIRVYSKLEYANSPKSSFDFLKTEVEDKLLDLAPELAEKLMLAFQAVSSDKPEQWSQALTTCRRFFEALADVLFPPIIENIGGRSLGQAQYINRIWAFMDNAIDSDSNKELAKAHIDLLGTYLQKIHKLSHKGVHSELSKVEAIKAVFHTYLAVADILQYLKIDKGYVKSQPNIHTATLDELESLIGINRNTAKEIIKLRVQEGLLTPELLSNIRGIGVKTISKIQEIFSFEPVTIT